MPREHIYGTEFRYTSSGESGRMVRATAGHGKAAALNLWQAPLELGSDHTIPVGDGSSGPRVMLHVNVREGFTIAVAESAQATVLGGNAPSVLVPIPVPDWQRVRTDGLTLRSAGAE